MDKVQNLKKEEEELEGPFGRPKIGQKKPKN